MSFAVADDEFLDFLFYFLLSLLLFCKTTRGDALLIAVALHLTS